MTKRHRLGSSSPQAPRLQDTVGLSAQRIAKVLGDLEARVMQAVWDIGRPAPAREVHERVIREHEVALLTVITVLNKLVAKKLLRRRKREGLLDYAAPQAWLAGKDHLGRLCRVAIHTLLTPVHGLFHLLFLGDLVYATLDRLHAGRTARSAASKGWSVRSLNLAGHDQN